MTASGWAWLKNRDEKRYRLAQAMRTYLNHLEGSVREARDVQDDPARPWGKFLSILEADEAVIAARLAGL